jgi:predicted nucleic acid-binding Zn ribbon protein
VSSTNSPQRLGAVLSDLFQQAGLRERLDAARAVEAWPSLAGPAIAAVTAEVWMRDGVFVVRLLSAPWRHQLQFQREAWRERLNGFLVEGGGRAVVKEVSFR